MTTFLNAKLKKSDDQTNIDKHGVAANITEFHIISKLIFVTIIIPKFMMLNNYFMYKMHVKCKKSTWLNERKDFLVTVMKFLRFFLHITQLYRESSYWVWNQLDNYIMPKLIIWTFWRPGIDYRVASLFTRYLTDKEIIPESLKSIGQF